MRNDIEELKDKIICGDALEVLKELPDESIDLVIADPPYNSNVYEWDKKDDEWQFTWLKEIKRILKDGGSLYVFFCSYEYVWY